jgi:plasmid stabilization system protein ParE
MTQYDFHPEAEIDPTEIWDYIADDNVSAADRVVLRTFTVFSKPWLLFLSAATVKPTSLTALYVSSAYESI